MARTNEGGNHDITAQLQSLVADDAFLTSLSQGQDPSGGTDPLAALFLELREDVERDMPPAPVVEGAEQSAAVISLGDVRRRRRANPWVAGLVGAAAATVVVAGSGAALYNASPDSPLWPASTALFGDRSNTFVVELAGTLDEIQTASDKGDEERTRELLEQARQLVADMSAKDPTAPATGTDASGRVTVTKTVAATTVPAVPGQESGEAPAEAPTETVEVTVTEVEPAPQLPPQTVTQTQVSTIYVQPPQRENPLTQEPAQPVAPGGETITLPAPGEVQQY